MRGVILIQDTKAFGPLRDDEEDQELDRFTFGTPVDSEKAYRVCWGIWDEDISMWRNMRGETTRPRSEWLRYSDVKEGGRYQPVPEHTQAEARFSTLWRPLVEGL